MKRLLIITVLLFTGALCVGNSVQASTLTVSIDGLEMLVDDTIWTYQMNFDIEGPGDVTVSFNETNQHQWQITQDISVSNWSLASNVVANQLVILASDNDWANGVNTKSPLVNSELFTVTYADDVTLSLDFDSFLLASDGITAVPLIKIPSDSVFGVGEHTLTVSSVPIPGTVLLFGSGLLGLMGIGRKRLRKS